MKTRRMAKLAVMAAALLASLSSRAATTNEVDISALVAAVEAGQSETNGWTLTSIGTYADSSLLFNAQGDSLLSKVYDAPIIGVVVSNRCSTLEPARVMCVFAGDTERELGRFPVVDKINKQKQQELMFADAGVKRIRFQMTTGNSGNWGIGAIWVITADPVYAPVSPQVSHNGGDWCALSWENGAGTVSNRVETFSIERGIGDDVLLSTDFETFSAKGNVVRMDSSLAELDPLLSGTNVYAYVNTNGICRLGKDDALGILRWAGVDNYANVQLRMSAMRYPLDNAETMVAFEWNGETNTIATLTLTDEFAEHTVDLSKDLKGNNTPDGAAILVGYYTYKTKRRVLIDSLSIVRTNTMVTTTSPVDSRWIPADSGGASFSTKDYGIELLPKSEYRFEVRAQNADGLVSDPSAVDVVLDSPPGFRFILR